MKAVGIVMLGILAHMVLGRWSPSPWLVPDLTALAMLTAILRLPGHPIAPAVVASVVAMALAVHHPLQSGAAYLLAGMLALWMAHQWDLTQPSTERLIVVACQAVLTLVLLGTIPPSADTLMWAMSHLAITVACLPLIPHLSKFTNSCEGMNSLKGAG